MNESIEKVEGECCITDAPVAKVLRYPDSEFLAVCEKIARSPPRSTGFIYMPRSYAKRVLLLAGKNEEAGGLQDRCPQFDTLSGSPDDWITLIGLAGEKVANRSI